MTVFVPLNGPNDEGRKPKAPSTNGWERIGYRGINPKTYAGWYGLRCDGLICIDCDGEHAMEAWLRIVGATSTFQTATWVRKTPHGYHFIYRWHDPLEEIEEVKGPHAGVLPGIDVRQGNTSQIVYSGGCGKAECQCDGTYYTLGGGPQHLYDFHAPWAATFKLRQRARSQAETWDEMPDGIGNNTMTAIAGVMRKQGMSSVTMARCLGAINKITMTADPMPKEMVLDIVRSVSRYEVDPFVDEIAFDDSDE